MNAYFQKLIRFIEIDINFLQTPLGTYEKLFFLAETNITIVFNILFRKYKYKPLVYGKYKLFYDTPFATKTFLTAVYDLYMVTLKGTIFKDRSKRLTIVDVGGNIGQFSFASKKLFPNSIIYTVEPDKDIFSILELNSKNFRDIKPINVALSDKNGKLKFFVSKEFSEWSSLKKIQGHQYQEKIVDVTRGDKQFESLQHIDLLKVDVEGAENETVSGFKKLLPITKYLLIEVSILRNNDDKGSSSLMQFLYENGFSLHTIGRIFSGGKGEEQGAADILFKNMRLKE